MNSKLFFAMVVGVIATVRSSLAIVAPPEDQPAVVASDLLPASVFPDAQFGMTVESAEDGAIATVITTGAEFRIDKANDQVECRQRIAAKRAVANVAFPRGSL